MASFIPWLPVLWVLLGSSGDVPAEIVFPPSKHHVSHASSMIVAVSYDTSRIAAVLQLTPYAISRPIPVRTEKERSAFPVDLYRLIPEDLLLQRVDVVSERRTLSFTYTLDQRHDLPAFWGSRDMNEIWEHVHDARVQQLSVAVTGWRTSSQESTPASRATFGNLFLFSIDLKAGPNDIRMLYLDSARTVIAADSLSIYKVVPTDTDGAPPEFERHAFHGSASEERCVSCHEDADGSCTVCHTGFRTSTSFHAAAEDCATCHDLNSDEDFRLIEGQALDSEFCGMCHGDKQELLANADLVHAVASECLTCHDPHASSYGSLLRDRTLTVCLSCHPDQRSRPHPTASHPFEAPRELYRDGKPLTCSSCHEPHASANPRLIRFDKRPICGNCHKR